MNKERLLFLYRKFKDQTISAGEWEELQQELINPLSHDLLGEELDSQWSEFSDKQLSELDPVRFDRVYDTIVQQGSRSGRTTKLWPRIVAVAAAVGLVVLGVYFFNYNKKTINNPTDLITQDIAPGKVGATLTLASGKKIRLADAVNGELANEAGISINKTADGRLVYEVKGSDTDPNKINTLSTANGETYQVRLPDGSMVYLNAASSLTYSASLNERGKRVVRLRGEGFFEVAKDKNHPFVVETGGQRIEVLGTHFNVNAYPDERNIKTTLIEGSVKVNSGKVEQVIRPGEQAVLEDDRIAVVKVDAEHITDWKDDDFVFNGDDFSAAMRKISRWYNVEIVYALDLPKNIAPGGWISRNNKISAVLKMIEASGQVHFKVEGRRVLVTR